MNWLKAVVAFIIVVSLLGTVFTGGQAQGAFEQLFIMGFVFILVVEFVPHLLLVKKVKPGRMIDDSPLLQIKFEAIFFRIYV